MHKLTTDRKAKEAPPAVRAPRPLESPKAKLNRIVQGDVLRRLGEIPGENVFDVVIADPPYNIGKDFGNNTDNLELGEYVGWSAEWINGCLRLLKPEGLLYVYGFPEILAHVSVRFPLENQRWLVWHYTNKTVPRLQFWQRSHEAILCLWKGQRPRLPIDEIREAYTEHYLSCIGKERKETRCRYNRGGNKTLYNGHTNGAMPRDVLKFPALAGGAGRSERWFLCRTCGGAVFPPEALRDHDACDTLKHPTQKPLGLSERLIKSVLGTSGGKLLVPFAGSGSECVVAKRLGIDFLGIEINREYVDFARKLLRRWGGKNGN